MARCPICRAEYKKWRMSQKVCGNPDCAQAYMEKEKLKNELREYRKRKESLKTRSDWLREAQTAFNRYIRERDRNLPCISCGRFHSGDLHAGHYRSVGAAPQLRFHEDNVHLQCAPCNTYKSGNAIEYRIKLLERIGQTRVEALEADNSTVKWTIDDAKRIKAEYTAKWKALKDAQDASTE